jgi:hypothetical protein
MRRAIARAIALATGSLAACSLAACDRRAPITSCDDDLRAVYGADPGGAEQWMVIDRGATLEAYALFPDGEVAGGVVAAPRAIDLVRTDDTPAGPGTRGPGDARGSPSGSANRATSGAVTGGLLGAALRAPGDGLTGTLHRRYMQRADSCDARVPVHVTRCAGDTLELVLADPSPPLGFAPCTWPRPAASRVVRWHRE